MHATLDELCKNIFAVDPSIRFAGVINKMGKLVAGGMRQGMVPLESIKDVNRLYAELALINSMRGEFDGEFGPTVYSFWERQKIKIASFPLSDDSFLLVSLERSQPHDKIISRILELVR